MCRAAFDGGEGGGLAPMRESRGRKLGSAVEHTQIVIEDRREGMGGRHDWRRAKGKGGSWEFDCIEADEVRAWLSWLLVLVLVLRMGGYI